MIYVDNGGAELVRQLLRTGEPFCVIEYGKSMWRFTPSLGLHVADIDELGNVVLTEHRLRAILAEACLLYTSPSPRDVEESRMPSSA